LGETTSSTWGKCKSGSFYTQEDSFYPRQKVFGLKEANLILPQMLISFSPSGLATILPQEVCSLLPPKEYCKKKQIREREGESEEGKKVIWCEELRKYGGVFIGGNGSIGYKHN